MASTLSIDDSAAFQQVRIRLHQRVERPRQTCAYLSLAAPIAGKTPPTPCYPEMSQFCNPVKSARPRSLSLSPYELVLPYRSPHSNVRRQKNPTLPQSLPTHIGRQPMQELAFGLAKRKRLELATFHPPYHCLRVALYHLVGPRFPVLDDSAIPSLAPVSLATEAPLRTWAAHTDTAN